MRLRSRGSREARHARRWNESGRRAAKEARRRRHVARRRTTHSVGWESSRREVGREHAAHGVVATRATSKAGRGNHGSLLGRGHRSRSATLHPVGVHLVKARRRGRALEDLRRLHAGLGLGVMEAIIHEAGGSLATHLALRATAALNKIGLTLLSVGDLSSTLRLRHAHEKLLLGTRRLGLSSHQVHQELSVTEVAALVRLHSARS